MHVVATDVHHVEDVGQPNDDRRGEQRHAEAVSPVSTSPAGPDQHEGRRRDSGDPQCVGGDEVPEVRKSLRPPGGRRRPWPTRYWGPSNA